MQIVIPPATKSEHISITIRKPSKTRFKMEDHIKSGLFEDLNPDDKNKIKPSDEELIKLYEARDYQILYPKLLAMVKILLSLVKQEAVKLPL